MQEKNALDAHLSDEIGTAKKFFFFGVMALGMFMALLDIQIVASSISEIQAGLAAAPDESSWIQTAYLMAEIIMIPLSGWLGRAFSTKWVFIASAAGFTLSSMACGLSWSIGSMIVARACQGFIGGAMIPLAFSAGFSLFKGKQQAIIPATLGILGSLAPSIGPSFGGWITSTLSWHWIFFINVVPGILIVSVMSTFRSIDKAESGLLKKFDWLGLALMAVFLGSLQYVLEEGYRWGWFEDNVIRNTACVSVVAGLAFMIRSLTAESPIVDLHLLKNRTFAVAALFRGITGFGMFASIYAVPLYLARIPDFDSKQIGDAVFVAGLAQILGAPLAARLSNKIDMRWMMLFGFSMFSLGLWLCVPITSEWTGREMFWPQVLRGFSILFCIVPATNMALGSLSHEKLKAGSALFNTTTNIGGAIGIASVNTLVNDRTNLHWHDLMENLRIGDPKITDWMSKVSNHIASLTADGLTHEKVLSILSGMVRKQAVTMAFSDVFCVIAVLFALGILLIPLLRRPAQSIEGISTEGH